MALPVFISLPRSKSIVIRCLIINYLKNGTLLPIFDDDANDIKVVLNALKCLNSSDEAEPQPSVIDVQDCGAAYRFLMPLLATTKGTWILTGAPRLLERPILPLVSFLKERGASIEKVKNGWKIEGRELQMDSFEIDTSETSQYASALMMVRGSKVQSSRFKSSKVQEFKRLRYEVCGAPKSPSNFEGVPEGRGSLYENPYIKMTQTILDNFDNCKKMTMLADWSAAVFWLANALLAPNTHYLLKDLHFDGLQGDAEIAPWFEKCGLSFTEHENGIEVKHNQQVEISEQHLDLSHTPDLAPVLAVLAVCYPFELTLSGLKNLNLKESNRLDIMIKELSKFTKIEKRSENKITIFKRTKKLPNAFHFDSYNDHRFVMAWSLFKNYGIVNIINPECIKKSYPTLLCHPTETDGTH